MKISGGERMARFLTLLVIATSIVAFGAEITVLNAPQGWIYVDGNPLFDSPRTFEVDPGKHELLLIAWGMVPYRAEIDVRSDETLRILMKPLKGWVKKVGVLVNQEGEGLEENAVADMVVSKLEEYNVEARRVEISEGPGVGKKDVVYAEILSSPWKYGMIAMYALQYIASKNDDLDFLIVGNFEVYDDRYSDKKAGLLRFIVYDLKEMGVLRTPAPYSDYEIYPTYSERYYKLDKVPPVFISLVGRSFGEDLMEIGERSFDMTLPYLLDMLVIYSTWKGLDLDRIKEENPDLDWEEYRWYLEKSIMMTQD